MNYDEKEHRCKACGKLLLDEKVPFCRRCVLKGRNKACTGGGITISAVGLFLGANRFIRRIKF